MAQIWTTGPAFYYAIVGGKANFLGTVEGKPTIDIQHSFEDVRNDIGGTVAMDWSFMGSMAYLSIPLTRWNEATLQTIRAVPNPSGQAGVSPFGTIGALVLTEGLYFGISIVFPYANLAAFKGMVRGYRFPVCRLERDTDQAGTSARRPNLTVVAQRFFNPKNYAFTLYDNDVGGLPNPD